MLVNAAIAVASVGLFAVAYAIARLVTRPSRVRPEPATPDLGDEPPAVVSLLVNRWRLTEDAAESTLLDLAARGYLELRQPGNDARHTTIHLREPARPEPALLPYERRVLFRARQLAVQGVVPVTALTFRNRAQAQRWNRRLRHEVVADARARGLSRRRFSPAVVAALTAVAAVTATGIAVLALRLTLREDEPDLTNPVWAGFFSFLLLASLASRPIGERDTPAGRVVAARWLGVRAWLRGHEEFANLPPAAVAVWDRYLPYGAAVGVTHVASEVLDLGMGNRRLVWSSHGGAWRRVRVRYPRFWPRYGQPTARLVMRGLLTAGAGGLLLWLTWPPRLAWPGRGPEPAGLSSDPFAAAERVTQLLPPAGGLLLLAGGYVLARTLIDLATTRTITGEVLWVQLWRSRQRKGQSSLPVLHYLAVDDGSRDRTTAWGLPGATPLAREHDQVRITVQPWSRRVTSLTVVARRTTDPLLDPPVAAPPGADEALGKVLRRHRNRATSLLTAEEVGRALGLAATGPQPAPAIGRVSIAVFAAADRGRQVLMVAVAPGRWSNLVWRPSDRGSGLPGIGEAAYLDQERAAVRVGAETAVVTLLGSGRASRDQLPWLLQQVATRLAAPPQPSESA